MKFFIFTLIFSLNFFHNADATDSFECYVEHTVIIYRINGDGSVSVIKNQLRTQNFEINKTVHLETKKTLRKMYKYKDGVLDVGGEVKKTIATATGTYLNSPQGDIIQAYVSIAPENFLSPEFGFVAPTSSPFANARYNDYRLPNQGGGEFGISCTPHLTIN
jgi:hypothetical protein